MVVARHVDESRDAESLDCRSQADLPEAPVIYLSLRGEPLTQAVVQDLSERPEVIMVCGRYGNR